MIDTLIKSLLATSRDVIAVSALLLSFQLFVLRQPIPHLRRLLVGLASLAKRRSSLGQVAGSSTSTGLTCLMMAAGYR